MFILFSREDSTGLFCFCVDRGVNPWNARGDKPAPLEPLPTCSCRGESTPPGLLEDKNDSFEEIIFSFVFVFKPRGMLEGQKNDFLDKAKYRLPDP